MEILIVLVIFFKKQTDKPSEVFLDDIGGLSMSDENKKNDFVEDDFAEDFEGTNQKSKSNKNRTLVFGLIFLMGAGGAFFYLTQEDSSFEDDFSLNREEFVVPKKMEQTPQKAKIEKLEPHEKAEEAIKTETPNKKQEELKAVLKKEVKEEEEEVKEKTLSAEKTTPPLQATGELTLISPPKGEVREYDLSSERALFSWNGNAEKIIFSRNSNLKPIHTSADVLGSEYYGRYFEPGTWYWQVKNSEGTSEVNSFTVRPSKVEKPKILTPQNGTEINGNNSGVNWTMTARAAFYRVQLTQKEDWVSPDYLFATSGTKLMLKGVAQGSYKLRVGSFSEVSGRWEYSDTIQVEVR